MILAIPLVFFIGGFLGWLYGQRSNNSGLPASETANKSNTSAVAKHSSVGIEKTVKSNSHSSVAINNATDTVNKYRAGADVQDIDELYKIAGRIKPLEYDLTQRKLEVKALKQALQDIKCINEKKMVSVRLQAENKSNLQNKAKLADKQNQIDELLAKLKDMPDTKTSYLKQQELTSTKNQLAGTLDNLTQSEERVAALQKKVSGLNQRLNSRSSEMADVQNRLKVSSERAVLLSERANSFDAELRNMGTLARKLQERDREIEILTAQLSQAKAYESQSIETKADNQVPQLLKAQHKYIEAEQMKADLDRLELVTAELEQSRVEIEKLGQSLAQAELAAARAKQNDIEVRRLRSEMQSLQKKRDGSMSKVHLLERQIQEQQRELVDNAQLKKRVHELESVEAENERCNNQIVELKKRLLELGNDTTTPNRTPKNQLKKTKLNTPIKPLYSAPAEKDDLKKINGIGPVMEKTLNSLGVTSFKQVAEFKPNDITVVTEAIKTFPGRIERDNWVGGAKEQYKKKYLKVDV